MRKKTLIAVLLGVCATFCACGHTHTYEKAWSFDGSTHWHKSTCGHEAMYGKEKRHVYGENGRCTVCGYEKTQFEFQLNAGKTGFILTGQGSFDSENLTVPAIYMDLPVVEIGECAFMKGEFSSVSLPDTLITVGEKAFADCPNLDSVFLGNGVQTIGAGAFSGCPYLETLTVGYSLTYIKDSAFKGCRSLTAFSLPEGLKEIGALAFSGCRTMSYFTIPSTVERIGQFAFHNMEDLTTIYCRPATVSRDWADDWNATEASVVNADHAEEESGGGDTQLPQ